MLWLKSGLLYPTLGEFARVNPAVPTFSEFAVDDLENLAQSILKSDGLLMPLILKQIGPESYEVLAGDREYYAAVRASV